MRQTVLQMCYSNSTMMKLRCSMAISNPMSAIRFADSATTPKHPCGVVSSFAPVFKQLWRSVKTYGIRCICYTKRKNEPTQKRVFKTPLLACRPRLLAAVAPRQRGSNVTHTSGRRGGGGCGERCQIRVGHAGWHRWQGWDIDVKGTGCSGNTEPRLPPDRALCTQFIWGSQRETDTEITHFGAFPTDRDSAMRMQLWQGA